MPAVSRPGIVLGLAAVAVALAVAARAFAEPKGMIGTPGPAVAADEPWQIEGGHNFALRPGYFYDPDEDAPPPPPPR